MSQYVWMSNLPNTQYPVTVLGRWLERGGYVGMVCACIYVRSYIPRDTLIYLSLKVKGIRVKESYGIENKRDILPEPKG